MFHFHGLQANQRLTFFHHVTHFYKHGEHLARHGRGHTVGVMPLVGANVGRVLPLQIGLLCAHMHVQVVAMPNQIKCAASMGAILNKPFQTRQATAVILLAQGKLQSRASTLNMGFLPTHRHMCVRGHSNVAVQPAVFPQRGRAGVKTIQHGERVSRAACMRMLVQRPTCKARQGVQRVRIDGVIHNDCSHGHPVNQTSVVTTCCKFRVQAQTAQPGQVVFYADTTQLCQCVSQFF